MGESSQIITPILELVEQPQNVTIIGKITNKSPIKQIKNFFEDNLNRSFSQLTISDDTGSIFLVLWNDQIDKYEVGDVLKIKNVSTTIFNGHLQLSMRKSTKIDKIFDKKIIENTSNNLSLRKINQKLDSMKKSKVLSKKKTKLIGPSSGGFRKGGFKKQ